MKLFRLKNKITFTCCIAHCAWRMSVDLEPATAPTITFKLNNFHIMPAACARALTIFLGSVLSFQSKSNDRQTELEEFDWCFPAFRQLIQNENGPICRRPTPSCSQLIFYLVSAFNWIRQIFYGLQTASHTNTKQICISNGFELRAIKVRFMIVIFIRND